MGACQATRYTFVSDSGLSVCIFDWFEMALRLFSFRSARMLYNLAFTLNFFSDFGKPVAFGMYTLLSSALLGIGTVLILLGAMLLEERFAPVLFLFILSTWLFLELHSAISNRY